MWQLCGIPCPHAIAAINYLGRDLAHFVDSYLKKETYMLAYQSTIEPMNGQKMWPRMNEPLLPPNFLKKVGRPKKVKKKDKTKKDPNPKKGGTIKCTICGGYEHNKRTCPNKGQQQTSSSGAQVQKKRGRPRKDTTIPP
ncbi:hypothetical protein Cni_G26276 [Canna indica]|uniref:Zinc finger PMZ-type domain-containing protein n=1 Tax=Canna indica TaxID=4628 RepID=A0AAQ3KZD2_9LILI|nr:hypothetical protein Cni_G26276 [Canna indica]